MKKLIAFMLVVLLIAFFTACNRKTEQESDADSPHPFATALIEFYNELPVDIWGGMSGNNFWDENAVISNTSAFLIDLDDNGAMGVIAYKGIGEVDFFRLIYLLNGELRTADFTKLWFYPFEISAYPLVTLSGGEGAGEFFYREADSDGTFSGRGNQISESEFLEILDACNVNENRWLPFILKPQEHRDGLRDSYRADDHIGITSASQHI